MHGRTFLLVLTVIAAACSPIATDRRTLEPAATIASSTTPVSSPALTPSPTLPTTPAPSPTPVARTIKGRATLATTGAGVAGVEVRGSPMPINDGHVSGPDATAVTDTRGAYTFNVHVWTQDALANSSSFQLMIQVTPPSGLLVLGVTNVLGGPPGGASGNLTRPTIVGDLGAPIDITLGPGHIVEGRITSGLTGAPLTGVGVHALGPNSMLIYGGQGDAFEIAASTETDTAGRYKLTVPSGTYVIQTPGPQGAQPRFWSDDPGVFQPTFLRVERNVAGIDMALVPVTQIGGYVRSGPSFGDGVEGARVAAYGAGGTCCRLVSLATSGYNGTFVMYVPPGTYRFVFDPPTGSPYAAQWWRAAAGFATATDVIVRTEWVQLEVELSRLRP